MQTDTITFETKRVWCIQSMGKSNANCLANCKDFDDFDLVIFLFWGFGGFMIHLGTYPSPVSGLSGWSRILSKRFWCILKFRFENYEWLKTEIIAHIYHCEYLSFRLNVAIVGDFQKIDRALTISPNTCIYSIFIQ